jgi:hypothetical protein
MEMRQQRRESHCQVSGVSFAVDLRSRTSLCSGVCANHNNTVPLAMEHCAHLQAWASSGRERHNKAMSILSQQLPQVLVEKRSKSLMQKEYECIESEMFHRKCLFNDRRLLTKAETSNDQIQMSSEILRSLQLSRIEIPNNSNNLDSLDPSQ